MAQPAGSNADGARVRKNPTTAKQKQKRRYHVEELKSLEKYEKLKQYQKLKKLQKYPHRSIQEGLLPNLTK